MGSCYYNFADFFTSMLLDGVDPLDAGTSCDGLGGIGSTFDSIKFGFMDSLKLLYFSTTSCGFSKCGKWPTPSASTKESSDTYCLE